MQYSNSDQKPKKRRKVTSGFRSQFSISAKSVIKVQTQKLPLDHNLETGSTSNLFLSIKGSFYSLKSQKTDTEHSGTSEVWQERMMTCDNEARMPFSMSSSTGDPCPPACAPPGPVELDGPQFHSLWHSSNKHGPTHSPHHVVKSSHKLNSLLAVNKRKGKPNTVLLPS